MTTAIQQGSMALAAACPVCFGAADGPMIDASIAGMLTLIAVTLVVLVAIAGTAMSIARRTRHAAAGATPSQSTSRVYSSARLGDIAPPVTEA